KAIPGIVIEVQRSSNEIRPVNAVVVDAVRQTAYQRIVSVAVQRDGKTGADASDTGDSPSIGKRFGTRQQPRQRKLILIVRHETVLQIISRQRAGPPEVERIDGVRNTGRLVDGFAERIG